MSLNGTNHYRSEWLYHKYPPLKGLQTLKSKALLLLFAFVALFLIAASLEIGVSRTLPGEVLSSVATKDVKSTGHGLIVQVHKNAGDKVYEGEILATLNFENRAAKDLDSVLSDLKLFLSEYGIETPLPPFSKHSLSTPSLPELESRFKELLANYQKCRSSYETKVSRTQNEISPLLTKEANFVARIERLKFAKMTPTIKAQIDEARTERDSVKAKIAILHSQIDSEYFDLSQSLIAETKEFSEHLEGLIQNREIKAPIAGRLGTLKLAKGAKIAVNQIYASVAPENSEPLFQTSIHPRAANRLSLGQKIKVRYSNLDWTEATIVGLDKLKSSNLVQIKANVQVPKSRQPSQEVPLIDSLKGEAMINVDNRNLLGLLFSRWNDLNPDLNTESSP